MDPNFDINVAAGGIGLAVNKDYAVTLAATGSITISWTNQVDAAQVNAIEITQTAGGGGGGGGVADYITTYTYTSKNQLATVTMPRPTGTQTRTFNYDVNGYLASTVNPETGTITYTVDPLTGLVQQKVDAKQGKVVYTYDSYKRLTRAQRYEWNGSAHVKKAEQETKYYYDANPFDGAFSQNLVGRLAAVEYFARRGQGGWNQPTAGAFGNVKFRETYSYGQSGLVLKKRLTALARYDASKASEASDSLEGVYTWDEYGKLLTQKYPSAHANGPDPFASAEMDGRQFNLQFDAMGRPKALWDNGSQTASDGWVTNVAYNEAGLPTAMTMRTASTGNQATEARSYNEIGQLLTISMNSTYSSYSFSYGYPATNNDGKASSADGVNFTYDLLGRLSTATASGWSAAYGYDGFGNLLSVTPTGAGPSPMNLTVDAATNRVNGWGYDLNGNVTSKPSFTGSYDVENRLAEATGSQAESYGYGVDNRRAYKSRRTAVVTGGAGDTMDEQVTFWSGGTGQRLGQYRMVWNGARTSFAFVDLGATVYFGAREVVVNGTAPAVAVDRLGSNRTGGVDYFPYGQEKGSVSAGDRDKYATYYHDSGTDLSYADQRYYATGTGRFMTADPYRASGGAAEPGSWNRYAYTRGDPTNRIDPAGLVDCPPGYRYDSYREACVEDYAPSPQGPPLVPTNPQDPIPLPTPMWSATDHPGISKAKNTLNNLFGMMKKDGKCKQFFDSLAQQAGYGATGSGLISQVQSAAIEAVNFVYDGPSASSVVLDPNEFSGAASDGDRTVSDWV